ncbi:hypothetical protein QBC33DRAFT_556097 [Phialemonium atrogriseum]|uniref:Uncharacterized protein n=1 Tax=Phialemonium atrogriseum TaxID=1093897 RepID=A0AAJ0FPX3_9PEZI|nr:uncharacterized protein QBC33DRAFT_556097 [Phialemonium atrogriseum]KAK1770624.1 hypothetical protein QBC33DRAFT_556097 [Phialemonium atrogriseum]
MPRGSRRRGKSKRLERKGPRAANESPEGSVANGDEPPSQVSPHGGHDLIPDRNPRRHGHRSPGAGRDNNLPPRARPEPSRRSHHETGTQARNTQPFGPANQPHRVPQPATRPLPPSSRRGCSYPPPDGGASSCSACAVIRAANGRLYRDLLAGLSRGRRFLDAWADDVGVGEGSTIEEMEWQPEPTTYIVPVPVHVPGPAAERRLSDMRRLVFAADAAAAAARRMPTSAVAVGPGMAAAWHGMPTALAAGVPAMGLPGPDRAGAALAHTCREYEMGAAAVHHHHQGHSLGGVFRRDGHTSIPPSYLKPPAPRADAGTRGAGGGGASDGREHGGPGTARRPATLTRISCGRTRDPDLELAEAVRARGGAADDAIAAFGELRPVMEGRSTVARKILGDLLTRKN